MATECEKKNHEYENNRVDAYVCKNCWKQFNFDEVDKWEDEFKNLTF